MNRNGMLWLKDIFAPNRYALEFYPAPGKERAPAALLCPGGGYGCVMSCVEGVPIAKALNDLGYAAFVLRYRVREKALFPAPLLDLGRAVKEITENRGKWPIDPNHYAIFGFSAGAHLTAMFGTEALGWKKLGLPRPEAVILSYPVITMGPKTHPGSRRYLLGKKPTKAAAARCSVEKRVSGQYPPTYLWYGDADKTVDPANSRMMADALQKAGVPCVAREYPGVDHGVGLGTGLICEGWLQEAVDFWRQQENAREES